MVIRQASKVLPSEIVEPIVIADARVVHYHVEVAERIERGLHDLGGSGLFGDGGEARDGFASVGLDLLDHLFCRLRRRAGTIELHAVVGNNHLGAPRSQEK